MLNHQRAGVIPATCLETTYRWLVVAILIYTVPGGSPHFVHGPYPGCLSYVLIWNILNFKWFVYVYMGRKPLTLWQSNMACWKMDRRNQ